MEKQSITYKGRTIVTDKIHGYSVIGESGEWCTSATSMEKAKAKIDMIVEAYAVEETEQELDQLYSESMTPDEAFERLEYLCNPSRGKHLTEEELRSNIETASIGGILKKFDPIAFYTVHNEK